MQHTGIRRFVRISLMISAIVFAFFYSSNAQIVHGKTSSTEAREHIRSLKKGALIVPLFMQLNKKTVIKEMLSNNKLDESTRKKLVRQLEGDSIAFLNFNTAVCDHFIGEYKFSRVYFIYDHQLKQFDPSQVVFVNPVSRQPDSNIQFEGESYYFLQYYSYSSPATTPYEVQFFYLADQQRYRLNSPFPFSPGRWDSFKNRFKELFGMAPEKKDQIKNLTIKLNEALFRYSGS
jgi:hypothetical protein